MLQVQPGFTVGLVIYNQSPGFWTLRNILLISLGGALALLTVVCVIFFMW
jgi:hypothetical protein